MENICIDKRVISIVSAKSNSGKTTLIEKLIKILKSKSYKVGVLKHDAHNFEIDRPGKDSYKFALCGADNVIIASNQKLAMIQRLNRALKIDEILGYFKDEDIIIIEGFKNNKYPKIEVHRKEISNYLLHQDDAFDKNSFIAIASDEAVETNIQTFDINDDIAIANFIENKIICGKANE